MKPWQTAVEGRKPKEPVYLLESDVIVTKQTLSTLEAAYRNMFGENKLKELQEEQ
jgi:hypothetical protein